MSFCRWSSLDGKCDLYMYESTEGGIVAHVASNRVVSPVFPSPSLMLLSGSELNFVWWRFRKWIHTLTVKYGLRRPIEHPDAGSTVLFGSAAAALEGVTKWREEGLLFPDRVLCQLAEIVLLEAECDCDA